MPQVGRKPTDISRLIFWEQHWWTTLLNIRQGVPSQMVDERWETPREYRPSKPPDWMTNPGALYDWAKETGFFSRLRHVENVTAAIAPELDFWNALKNATSVRQVQRICRQSKWQSRLTMLYENASQFIEALRSPRY